MFSKAAHGDVPIRVEGYDRFCPPETLSMSVPSHFVERGQSYGQKHSEIFDDRKNESECPDGQRQYDFLNML